MVQDPLVVLFFAVTVASLACAIELIKCRKQLEKNTELLAEIAKKSR